MSKVDLSENEVRILGYTWQCFKSGPPEVSILTFSCPTYSLYLLLRHTLSLQHVLPLTRRSQIDYQKLAGFTNHANPKSAYNAVLKIKQKLNAAATGPDNADGAAEATNGSTDAPVTLKSPTDSKKSASKKPKTPKEPKEPKEPKTPKASGGKKRKSTEADGDDDATKVKEEQTDSDDAGAVSKNDEGAAKDAATKDDSANAAATPADNAPNMTKAKAAPKSKAKAKANSPPKEKANSPVADATDAADAVKDDAPAPATNGNTAAKDDAGSKSPTATKKPRGRPAKKAKTSGAEAVKDADVAMPQTDGKDEKKDAAANGADADANMTGTDEKDELTADTPALDVAAGAVEVAV